MTVITPCLIKKTGDNAFVATYPEYPDCKVEANSLESIMNRAVAYLCSWLRVKEENPVPHKGALKPPSKLDTDEFFTLISANLDEFDEMIKFYDIDIVQFYEWLNGDLELINVRHIRENDNTGIDDIDIPDNGEFEEDYDVGDDVEADDADIPDDAFDDENTEDKEDEKAPGKPLRSASAILGEILDEEAQSREKIKKKKEDKKNKPIDNLEERLSKANKSPIEDWNTMFGEFSFGDPKKTERPKTSLDKTLEKIKEEENKKEKPMIEKLDTDVDDDSFVFTPYKPGADKTGNTESADKNSEHIDLLDENDKIPYEKSYNRNKKQNKKNKNYKNKYRDNDKDYRDKNNSGGFNKNKNNNNNNKNETSDNPDSSENTDGLDGPGKDRPKRMFNPGNS